MSLTFLDHINLGWIWAKTYLPEAKRWHRKRHGQGIRVFYGFDQVPGPGDHAAGGIVKIQDLQRAYPNCQGDANVLYLVSSALPHHAVRMAAMAKRAGCAVVINQNGVAYPGWYGRGWKSHNRTMEKLLHMADYVFYQSAFCKISADKFLGKPDCPFEILYNPVDTRVFVPARERSLPGKRPRLLIAGSHQSRYRPAVALGVLQRLLDRFPDARLTIAGRLCWEKDPRIARRQLERDVEEAGLDGRVRISGPYSQQQAAGMFQQADLLLHTKYNDPCPRLVVEAMACGLPIVYSATGGVTELVGERAGVGIAAKCDWQRDHPPDPGKMAAGAAHVISHWDVFSREARRRAVVRFDVKPWIRRHQAVFKRLVAQIVKGT